jgi:hypothetical protein
MRLGRRGWTVGLLAVVCALAAHTSTAARSPTLFRLSIAGSAHQVWAHTGAPVEQGTCTRTETTEGIRTATFRTKEPVVVRLLGGRVLPMDARGIMGTVTLGGANSSEEVCGGTGTGKTGDCAQTRRSFSGAHVRLVSPGPGVVAIGPIVNVGLARADCPREPADVRRRPLGPLLGVLRLPKEALMEGRLSRITLTGSRTQRTVYASPEKGQLNERVQWTLTFVRVQA